MKLLDENHASLHHSGVMLATAKFLSALCLEGEYRYQPDYLAEIFEDILKTEIGDDLDIRTKMISCIKTSKMLVKALGKFTDQQIQKACQKSSVCNNVFTALISHVKQSQACHSEARRVFVSSSTI